MEKLWSFLTVENMMFCASISGAVSVGSFGICRLLGSPKIKAFEKINKKHTCRIAEYIFITFFFAMLIPFVLAIFLYLYSNENISPYLPSGKVREFFIIAASVLIGAAVVLFVISHLVEVLKIKALERVNKIYISTMLGFALSFVMHLMLVLLLLFAVCGFFNLAAHKLIEMMLLLITTLTKPLTEMC